MVSLTLHYSNVSDVGHLSVAVSFAKARLVSKLKGPLTNDAGLSTTSHDLHLANGGVITGHNCELSVM